MLASLPSGRERASAITLVSGIAASLRMTAAPMKPRAPVTANVLATEPHVHRAFQLRQFLAGSQDWCHVHAANPHESVGKRIDFAAERRKSLLERDVAVDFRKIQPRLREEVGGREESADVDFRGVGNAAWVVGHVHAEHTMWPAVDRGDCR